MTDLENLGPLLGEYAWHSITVDPSIPEKSEDHFRKASNLLETHSCGGPHEPLAILEVGSYAHTSGYTLQARFDARVTLFDISAKTLKLGRQLANHPADSDNPTLVAGDFHELPFEDESFDLVFVSSSIHHTWRWRPVVEEMLRVLNAEGLLFVENEPCLRHCCFYKFQTNRREEFTAFETELDRLGVLQTFAEPYPGSRPESLFGMVENQKIPLDALLGAIEDRADFLETRFDVDICMGKLERSWVRRGPAGPAKLKSIIYRDLQRASGKAAAHLGRVEQGLGFTLPDDNEVEELAATTAAAICSLPPADKGVEHRRGLAKIFGAGIQVIARKRGTRTHPSSGQLSKEYPRHDGVVYSFGDSMARILMEGGSQLPDIQTTGAEEVYRFFPETSWRRHVNENAAQLSLVSQPGVILVPPSQINRVLLLRYHCLPPDRGCTHVTLRLLPAPGMPGEVLYSQHVWQPGGFLCVSEIPGGVAPGPSELSLHGDAEDENGVPTPLNERIAVVLAALFPYQPG